MCSVVGCTSDRCGAQRFKLPEDPERRLDWVMFIANVNKQRFKESSWTDITVCIEHFTSDCLVNLSGSVQLKPSAVPSLCGNSGSEDAAETFGCDEPVDYSEIDGQHDQLETHDGPNPCSKESRLASMGSQNALVPSGASCSADSSLCGQSQPKHVDKDLIKEKAALLKKKGKFPVNENRLLQLFSRKCPSCGGKLKMHKVTRGVTITLNQLCIRCDYTYQWKSWADRSDPAAENQLPTGDAEVNAETTPADEASSGAADVPEIISLIDEETDSVDESKASSETDTNSDEDCKPVPGVFPVKLFHVKPNKESKEPFDYSDYYPELTPRYSLLCTDCGRFCDKRRPHICEHKLKPFSCNICGKRCVSEVALNSHSRIHDENYEFRCKYCQVTFKLRVDKYIHEQIHMTQGKPYKCPDCPETFATSSGRRVHLEDHRGTVDLKCRFCGIEFFRPLSIQRHLLVHTGEKPYKCSVCQRGFNQASHLKSHMRLHTGERPYKCRHCDKCFNHNVSLKSHLQRYHGVASSEPEQKSVINRNESDTDAVQSSGNKRGSDSELDTEEEDDEEDTDDDVQMKGMCRTKSKWKSTGRPKGRPKSSAASDQGSNTTRKSRVKREMRKKCTDEENEEAPSDDNTSPDSAEETEKRQKKPKKKTARSQSNGKNISKRRGRPRKELISK